MLAKTVLTRLQSLMTLAYGPKSNYADMDYLTDFVSIRNEDVNLRIQSLGLNFDTQVVVLLGVPANTTDLSSYQADGQALGALVIPDSGDGSDPIEWRVAGQTDLMWQPVPWVGKVEDTNGADPGQPIASISSAVDSFEWRAGIIVISPCNVAVDLRIRGTFLPILADNDAAQVIKGLANVIAYWTGEMVSALGPGGESGPVHTWFATEAARAENDFVCNLSKAQLTKPVRLGGRRTQWFGPMNQANFTPPIVG